MSNWPLQQLTGQSAGDGDYLLEQVITMPAGVATWSTRYVLTTSVPANINGVLFQKNAQESGHNTTKRFEISPDGTTWTVLCDIPMVYISTLIDYNVSWLYIPLKIPAGVQLGVRAISSKDEVGATLGVRLQMFRARFLSPVGASHVKTYGENFTTGIGTELLSGGSSTWGTKVLIDADLPGRAQWFGIFPYGGNDNGQYEVQLVDGSDTPLATVFYFGTGTDAYVNALFIPTGYPCNIAKGTAVYARMRGQSSGDNRNFHFMLAY